MRIKPRTHRYFISLKRQNRASILLVTMTMVILLFFFSVTILYQAVQRANFAWRHRQQIELAWLNRSVLAITSHQIAKGDLSLTQMPKDQAIYLNQVIDKQTLSANLNYQKPHQSWLTLKKHDSYHSSLKLVSRLYSTSYSNAIYARTFHYSDYLFYFNKNIQLIAIDDDLTFQGSIYVAGNLQLGAYGGDIHFYMQPQSSTPFVYAEGQVNEYPGLNNASGIQFHFAQMQQSHNEPIIAIKSSRDWQSISSQGDKKWVQDINHGSKEMPFLTFRRAMNEAMAQANEVKRYSLTRNKGPFVQKLIINPKLVRKRLLGMGTDNKRYFAHNLGYVPQRIYIDYATDGQNIRPIHPVSDLDNSQQPDQAVSFGSIKFSRKIISLDLPDAAYDKYGVIRLGNRNFSRIARRLGIRALYLNGNVLENKLKPDQYIYKANSKELKFKEPLHSQFFVPLPGAKADGHRRDFATGDMFPHYAYVNGKRKDISRIRGRIIFRTPPERGSTISVLTKKPELYISKELPTKNTGVYIDQSIHAMHVNLTQLQGFRPSRLDGEKSKKPIYIFQGPVFLEGDARDPVAIIVMGDAYLGNINRESWAKSVTLICQGVVWAIWPSKGPLTIRHLWFLSQGDQLFSIGESSLAKGEKHLFVGSAVFCGKLHNAFIEKNISKSYLYSVELFENWHFLYDPSFSKPRGRPYLLSATYSIIGIDW